MANLGNGSYEINFDVWGLDNLREAEQIINDIRYGVGVIMSEEEALYLWASGQLSAADMVNKMRNGDIRAHLSEGGTVDYTGLAMVHGKANAAETMFNAKDSRKLYNLVHSTPDLMADMVNKAMNIKSYTPLSPSPTSPTVINNTVNVDKVVTDSPEDFTKQLDKYYQTKLTASYTTRT